MGRRLRGLQPPRDQPPEGARGPGHSPRRVPPDRHHRRRLPHEASMDGRGVLLGLQLRHARLARHHPPRLRRHHLQRVHRDVRDLDRRTAPQPSALHHHDRAHRRGEGPRRGAGHRQRPREPRRRDGGLLPQIQRLRPDAQPRRRRPHHRLELEVHEPDHEPRPPDDLQ